MYLEVRASCSAFSCSALRASSIWWFFVSTSAFWLGEHPGLLFQLLVGPLELILLLLEQLLGVAERGGLLLQPRVLLLELFLLALQLLGQRLGLLEQLLGAHARGDRVQHDADAFGELIEEGQVDVGEGD